jgi:hypothetical protein
VLPICYETTEYLNLLPFIFQELRKYYNCYDIYNKNIDNQHLFDHHHRTVVQASWKSINFIACNLNDGMVSETNKKRIDKEHRLTVTNRLGNLMDIILAPSFQPLQHNIYSNMMYFYKLTNDCKM